MNNLIINADAYCKYDRSTLIFEPGHSTSYKNACASSKDSDQPVRHRLEGALGHWLPTECHAKTGQTARMRRLI